MVRVPCPKCKEISYTPSVELFFRCPQCGFLFSGRFGEDRRREERFSKRIIVKLSHKGQEYSGRTTDISGRGMGIKIPGSSPFTAKDVLSIRTKEWNIPFAEVIWIKAGRRGTTIGLQKLNG